MCRCIFDQALPVSVPCCWFGARRRQYVSEAVDGGSSHTAIGQSAASTSQGGPGPTTKRQPWRGPGLSGRKGVSTAWEPQRHGRRHGSAAAGPVRGGPYEPGVPTGRAARHPHCMGTAWATRRDFAATEASDQSKRSSTGSNFLAHVTSVSGGGQATRLTCDTRR